MSAEFQQNNEDSFTTAFQEHRRQIRRHAPRNPYEEDLSPEAIAEIHTEAQGIYEDILRHKLGSIFYILPSNVLRAMDTRKHLESALKDIVHEERDSSTAFIDYNKLNGDGTLRDKLTSDTSKRWVITNVPDLPDIGIPEGLHVANVWDRMQADFKDTAKDSDEMAKNVHNFISMVNVTRKDELEELIVQLKPYISTEDADTYIRKYFNPKDFLKDTTPEEGAIEQLEAIARETKLIEDQFGEKHVHGILIAHAPMVDYITMALIGMEINLKNWNAFGGIRGYLEPADFDFDENGDLVYAQFRNRNLSTSEPIRIKDVVQTLRAQAQARKKEWGL